MDVVIAGFNRRPIAGIGLVMAVVWVAVVAIECFTMAPWDIGGWYAHLIETVDFAWRGVVGVVALAWLVEQAFA